MTDNPFFVTIPAGSDRATADAIRAQAKAEGREAVPEIPPTHVEQKVADWLATTPTCATDRQAFLRNLDDIAAGRVRPVGKVP